MNSIDHKENGFFYPQNTTFSTLVEVYCPHCQTKQKTNTAEVFCWPDRVSGPKKGLICICPTCGNRIDVSAIAVRVNNGTKKKGTGSNMSSLLVLAAVFLVLFFIVKGTVWPQASKHPSDSEMGGIISEVNETNAPANGGEVSSAPEIAVENLPEPEPEPEPIPVAEVNKKMPPISLDVLNSLPNTISTDSWNTDRTAQGIEWNTDTMDRFYVSIGKYLVASDLEGNCITSRETVDGYFLSIEYYKGNLYTVWRYEDYSNFKIRIYNAETLKLVHQCVLRPVNNYYNDDKEYYGSDQIHPSIDAITIAPALGEGITSSNLMAYISYNSYDERTRAGKGSLSRYQTIMELDLDTVRKGTGVDANRIWNIDLGTVECGIENMEFDRSTGNIWCTVWPLEGNDSVYQISRYLDENGQLQLVYNGDYTGWDVNAAPNGFCSLGNDVYYVLEPDYGDKTVACTIRKMTLGEL